MVRHTLEILEFDKVTENISLYSMSDAGKQMLLSQGIEDNYDSWKKKTDAVFSIKKMFEDNIYFPEVSLPDIAEFLKKGAVEGAALEIQELASVMNYLAGSIKLRKHLCSMTDNPMIRDSLDFTEPVDIVNTLSRFIRSDGTFREENVKELQAIRAGIGALNRTINRIVSGYTNDPSFSQYLQENSSTIRDNRVVLPVRENFRGKIKGIVHGSSSRGMTLFVEPVELFEYNNGITELEEKYRQEIHKILRQLTSLLRENMDLVLEISEKITFLDTIIARARFAYANKCILPEISEKGLSLKNARHFLLGIKAVPVDIIISGTKRALLVSGPNTGGKTVALKTAGLAVLMNQFCSGILADEGSSVAIFDNVLADIGDEQSIAGSLSTFSAHMKNISQIIDLCSGRTLVLLDEPGTGTDPDEGSALSMAVFDLLLERDTVFMATTHQGTLKNYAAGKKEMENVSVAYDRETYRPEYRIIYGLPGESFGIDVAGKSGIPAQVIGKAREYLGSEKININRMLREIGIRQQEIQEREKELESAEKASLEAKRAVALKEIALRQKEYELKNTERRAVSGFLRESRKKIENIIKEIVEQGADEVSRQHARDFIEQIVSEEEKYESRIREPETETFTATGPDTELEPGSEVFVGEGRKNGEIIRLLKNSRYLVAVGSLRMEVDRSELFTADAGRKKNKNEIKAEVLHHELNNTQVPVFELDVRGLRADEAVARLERQIDSALVTGLSTFSVIHGHGEGKLRKAITEHLAASPAIKKYYHAHPDSGGFGKTIVEL